MAAKTSEEIIHRLTDRLWGLDHPVRKCHYCGDTDIEDFFTYCCHGVWRCVRCRCQPDCPAEAKDDVPPSQLQERSALAATPPAGAPLEEYRPAEQSAKQIISDLEDMLDREGVPYTACAVCGAAGYLVDFHWCHEGSTRYCCRTCVQGATAQGKTLCRVRNCGPARARPVPRRRRRNQLSN